MAKELGAKRAIELPVSVAAHSPLMARRRRDARGPRGRRVPRPRAAAARQRGRPLITTAGAAAPSSSST